MIDIYIYKIEPSGNIMLVPFITNKNNIDIDKNKLKFPI